MLNPKAYFGHFTTNYEIFIAGGANKQGYALTQVENYDIKSDIWTKKPDLNHARKNPSMCLFRNKFLYVFGGTQLKDTDEIEKLEQEALMVRNSKQRKQESEGSLKLSSAGEEEEQEEDEDALSAEGVSEGSFFDQEEADENYQIDFGEYYVTQIERLDM